MAQPAKQRKRDAVGNLRDLAEELGVAVEVRKKPDMIEQDFLALFHKL
jgi:phage terminase small subunit